MISIKDHRDFRHGMVNYSTTLKAAYLWKTWRWFK